jgi:hypothetical protein
MRKIADLTLATAVVLGLALAAPVNVAAQEAPEAPEVPELSVTLTALDGSEAHATASFQAIEDGTTGTAFEVHGTAHQSLSVFIFSGTCAEPGEVRAALGSFEVVDGAGSASAIANVTFSELIAGPATVQLHPAGEEPTQAAFCGELTASGSDLR